MKDHLTPKLLFESFLRRGRAIGSILSPKEQDNYFELTKSKVNLLPKNILSSFSKIHVHFKLVTGRRKTRLVNNCDIEKMEDKLRIMHFQKQRKQYCDIFKIYESPSFLLTFLLLPSPKKNSFTLQHKGNKQTVKDGCKRTIRGIIVTLE